MKTNPADGLKDTMWRFLMTGKQKGNPQLLKEYVYDLIQMATQKTAGQRGNKKDISFDELQPLEWSIIIEATCLVLSGQIDKLIEDKGENNDQNIS
ncbi:hypothetical protein [Absicoccus porci]|uniref:hypothetical protein n=1 Tax=Absicoccus porci TaxID=2486576 RepID=UPI0029420934|nr:hypothetical protein [Absicoccus porci]